MKTRLESIGSELLAAAGCGLALLVLVGCATSDPVHTRFPNAAAAKPGDVKAILDSGADPNMQVVNGRTLLHQAVQNGYVESVRMLLDRGANPNLKDHKGLTPTFLAARATPEILKLLLQHRGKTDVVLEDGTTMLHLCALVGNPNTAACLLDLGFPVDGRRPDGQGPLHAASLRPNPDMLAFLISKGAPVDAIDNAGCAPLMMASMAGRYTNCLALMKAGASLSMVNQAGFNPLQCAILAGEFETASFLIRAGARVPASATEEVDARFCNSLYEKLLADHLQESGRHQEAAASYTTAADGLRRVRQDFETEIPQALHKAKVKEFWSNVGKRALLAMATAAAAGAYSAMDSSLQRSNYRLMAQSRALHEAKSQEEYFAFYSVAMADYRRAPSVSPTTNGPPPPRGEQDPVTDARVSFLRWSIEVCDSFLADIGQRTKASQ